MNAFILAGVIPGAGALLFLEWRRADARHLILRLVATATAVAALVLLVQPPALTRTSHMQADAALWTFKSQGAGADIGPSDRFVLPNATHVAAPDAKIIPDAATLRRLRPELQNLVIYGDGLDPAELPVLEGLHVEFCPPEHPVDAAPSVMFLRCPRTLPLGEPLVVSGRVGGVAGGAQVPLAMKAPDGTKIEANTETADAGGEAAFTLRASAPTAAGRYTWQLRVGQTTESLGVSVVTPALPRVLVLEAGPRFETAALRHWYEGAGGKLTVRTQVGQGRFQSASSQGATPPFTTLDAGLLGGYDLVVADARAVAALGDTEHAALLNAVEENGIGLLLRADDALLPSDAHRPSPELDPFLAWKLSPADDTPPGDERLVRPHWLGQTFAAELSVPAVPFFVELTLGQETLIDDRRDHALVSAVRRGRGQVALTLVGDTTRWQRGNDFAAFAAYWSFLFERLSGPSDDAVNRWSLVDGDGGPVFVDHPLQLRRIGLPGKGSAQATVMESSDDSTTRLPLAHDPQEPGVWRGTFWPRHGGWHRVADQSGGPDLDFFVHPAGSWPTLQSARRRLATARFADASGSGKAALPVVNAWRVPAGWWFALFVVSAGYLWTERRLAGGHHVVNP